MSFMLRLFGHATPRPMVTAMQQIVDWVQKLELSKHAQCFVENGVGIAVLPDLTDQGPM
jgi:hypothetical protein